MTKEVKITAVSGEFAEDKDSAKAIREQTILPALDAGHQVRLDFSAIQFATQSFVHALIGEALKKYGEDGLDRFEFKNCSPQIRGLIELVVDYSLGGFPSSVEA